MNRGTLDIVASMLTATQKDALKSYIIDTCHLSSKQFSEYTQILLEKGLIHAFPAGNLKHTDGLKNRRRTIFHISKTGNRFLELYSELCALVDRNATMSFRGFSFLFRQKGVGAFLHRQGEQE